MSDQMARNTANPLIESLALSVLNLRYPA